MSIEQYIKERIENIRKQMAFHHHNSNEYSFLIGARDELQAVLSKIEELGMK